MILWKKYMLVWSHGPCGMGNRLVAVGVWERTEKKDAQGLKSKSMDYEREKERRRETQGWSMKKEEKKKGKINEGDVRYGGG
jgi:hypothetical protein